MSTIPSVKGPGQKFLTTRGYQAVNAAVMDHARKSIEGSLGSCTPDDVRAYILEHRQEIESAYRAVGLSGPEIPNTWKNLLLKTKREARMKRGGDIQDCVDRAYVAARDRRFQLMT